MMPKSIAIYPGSFDPPTYGHMNIVERSLKIFDKVIIAIATNPAKNPLFTPEERIELLNKIYRKNRRVEIDKFHGLLVHYARKKKVKVILRGLRTVADYEYESQMAFSNKSLDPGMETLFMMTENKFSHISSTLIKEITHFGESSREMVPPLVRRQIEAKIKRKK